MMKPSQVCMRKQRVNFACTGAMGAAVNCASEIAPGPSEYRGPRGPSGVMAMSPAVFGQFDQLTQGP